MGGNRGRDKIFGVECCVTLHYDWPILKVRKIGETELVRVQEEVTCTYIPMYGAVI